ncbi:MAG: ROK family transcriptional regulator [Sarcina sp.]
MKNLNEIEKLIYRSLLISKKLKKDLMEDLTLPKTTVNRSLENLIKKGLIEKQGLEISTGGRKPIIYAPVSDSFYSIGIDISRSYSEILLINSSLEIIYKNRFPMTFDLNSTSTVEKIISLIYDALSTLNIDSVKILGIGLGVIEPIDVKTGIMGCITNPLNDSWTNMNIKELFSKYLDIPIYLNKGTNMAAIGEYFINKDKNTKKIIYLNLGRGIRYSLINNGQITDSQNEVYDALGHMTINLNGEKCICGKSGCLELYATINAIETNFNKNSNSDFKSIDDIFKLFVENNSKAKESIDNSLFALASGINNFSSIINPDKVILNGPLMQKHNYVFEKLIENFKLLNPEIASIYSNTPSFGDSSIAFGAAIECLKITLKL